MFIIYLFIYSFIYLFIYFLVCFFTPEFWLYRIATSISILSPPKKIALVTHADNYFEITWIRILINKKAKSD